MKALSLTQPWATLIAIGAKQIETRSWPTPHRGEVAIHASRRYPLDCRHLEVNEPFRSALRNDVRNETPIFVCGHIIAVAELIDCLPSERFRTGLGGTYVISDNEDSFGDFSARRFGFVLDNVRRITPIRVNGALGLWTVPDGIELTIREELEA